jgi:phosphoribosylformylglycinamidine synthase
MTASRRFLAHVYVSLKPTVNDPEGNTIADALRTLGFSGLERVRSGRYFQLTVEAEDEAAARRIVDGACARLLANPVIETYRFDIEHA